VSRSRGAAPAALLVALSLPLGFAARGQAIQQFPEHPVAVLQGLDKITARISTFETPIDQPIGFGALEITVRSCHKRPPTEPPESAAFLEIVERRQDEPSVRLFTGWMFASSPALSAMEHPVYDVWVLDCKELEPGEPGEAPPGTTQ